MFVFYRPFYHTLLGSRAYRLPPVRPRAGYRNDPVFFGASLWCPLSFD